MQPQAQIQTTALMPTREDRLNDLGKKALLLRTAGYTDMEIAAQWNLDPKAIQDIVATAIDDQKLDEIYPLAAARLYEKTLILDNELVEMQARLLDVGKETFETAVKNEFGGIEVIELKKDVSNIAAKLAIIKERRQILSVQKMLIGGHAPLVDPSEDAGDTFLKEVAARAIEKAMGGAMDRLKDAGREIGRLEAEKDQSVDAMTVDAEEVKDGE